jgi:hypothetical protein
MTLSRFLVAVGLLTTGSAYAISEPEMVQVHAIAATCSSPLSEAEPMRAECRVRAALIGYYGSADAYRVAAEAWGRARLNPPTVGPDPGDRSSAHPADRGV